MKLQVLASAIVLGLVLQSSPSVLAQPNGVATLIESTSQTINGRTMYRVIFSYAFPGRNSIYVTGVGQVSPSGALTFYTEASRIDFKESYDGITLYTIYLNQRSSLNWHSLLIASNPNLIHSAPVLTLGSDVLLVQQNEATCANSEKFPVKECFASGTRSETWKPPLEFAERLNRLMNKEFPLGIKSDDMGTTKFIITSFERLNGPVPWNLEAQISLFISYKDPGSNPQSVRITYTVQPLIAQRRRRETQWKDNNIDVKVKTAGAAYVAKFIEKLNSHQPR